MTIASTLPRKSHSACCAVGVAISLPSQGMFVTAISHKWVHCSRAFPRAIQQVNGMKVRSSQEEDWRQMKACEYCSETILEPRSVLVLSSLSSSRTYCSVQPPFCVRSCREEGYHYALRSPLAAIIALQRLSRPAWQLGRNPFQTFPRLAANAFPTS